MRIAKSIALLASLALPVAAFATPIAVNNPSFETLPPGGLPFPCNVDCSYSVDSTPGWAGGSGQFQPGPPANTAYFNSVPDGITVGYANGTTFSQVLAPLVQNGVTYTLTVQIGLRNDAGGNFGSTAGFLLGGTDYIAATGIVPTAGNWSTYTATFTGDASTAGDTIGIQLFGGGYQGDFDDVTVNDSLTPIPEPSSMVLLGTGLIGAAGFARRKLFRS